MKPFNDTYVMYWLLESIDESSIIALCKASKKLNKICKNYLELENDKRFEIHVSDQFWDDSILLEKYCKNNDVIKIGKMIKMNLYWNLGLCGACKGGHINIINLMIEKGADHLNGGLYDACSGGHIDIVKFMIEKGADHWNSGLWRACESGHIDIVKLMIEKGATVCGDVYDGCKKSMEEHLSKNE